MIIFQYGYSIESISWPTYEKCHKQVGKFIPMLGWRGLPSWIYDNIQNVCWYTAGRNPPSSANRFHNTQYIYIHIILYQILNWCETWETQLIAAYQGDSQKGWIAVLGETSFGTLDLNLEMAGGFTFPNSHLNNTFQSVRYKLSCVCKGK